MNLRTNRPDCLALTDESERPSPGYLYLTATLPLPKPVGNTKTKLNVFPHFLRRGGA
jgi:hypothetical protein